MHCYFITIVLCWTNVTLVSDQQSHLTYRLQKWPLLLIVAVMLICDVYLEAEPSSLQY